MHSLKKALYIYAIPRMAIAFVMVFAFMYLMGIHWNPIIVITLVASLGASSFLLLAIYEKHVIETYSSARPFFTRIKDVEGNVQMIQSAVTDFREIKPEEFQKYLEEADLSNAKKRELEQIVKEEKLRAYYAKFLDPAEIEYKDKEYEVQEAILLTENLEADLAGYPDVEFAVRGCFIYLNASVMTWFCVTVIPLEEKKEERRGMLVGIVLDSKAKDKTHRVTEPEVIKALVGATVQLKSKYEEELKIKEAEIQGKEEVLKKARSVIIKNHAEELDLDIESLSKAARTVLPWTAWAIIIIGLGVAALILGALFSHAILHFLGR